jgi:hypothetical protein
MQAIFRVHSCSTFGETFTVIGPSDPKSKQPGPWKNSYFQGPKSVSYAATTRNLSIAAAVGTTLDLPDKGYSTGTQ